MFIAEAAPIHHLDVFLVIYKLITGGCRTARTPPATAIIVWPRPDRAICSSRRAAPLPPRSCLGVVPNAHPSSLLCCTNKGQEDTRKRAQSLTRVPASNQKARTPRGPQKKTVPGQQKANAWPLPSSAHHCVPVFPSRFQIILVRPALSASLCCHYASRRNPLVFLKSWRKAPESPLWCGREAQGESISHLPNQLPESSLAARSPENNIRASTMHIQSGIHLLTPRRPALQHHALTIKGYSGSGALSRTTLMHTRSYFNALQIMWLIILYDCVSHHHDRL